MGLKDSWKDTGKGLGNAIVGLGKTLVKTAEAGLNKLDGDETNDTVHPVGDGSWKETGKELGAAFKDLGKTLLETAEAGKETVQDIASDVKEEITNKEKQ